MLFNSFSFLVFFPVVVALFFAVPARFQRGVLLIASCYFYMSFVPKYIVILFLLITIDFFAAQEIEKRAGDSRKLFLWLSIVANLGMLFVFKYFNFFNTNIADLAHFLHWNYSPLLLTLALPLGLSFHIFQSLSYVIEVYRGKTKTERNYLTYALYVLFFPQLVAGPIERPQHLLPQLNVAHSFNADSAKAGLQRMLWGFFKKLVIADNLSVMVSGLFQNPPADTLGTLFLMVLFAYQLYCDFSGYSDIAIGSAQVLGFTLAENFNRPFASRSTTEFWHRWHISLSSWLRDYLFNPLALVGGRVTKARIYLSTFITFVLIGLWHGANWTFVVFGALNGTYLVIGSITENTRKKLAQLISITRIPRVWHAAQTVTVFFLMAVTFVFFRAENISQAVAILSHLITGLPPLFTRDFWLHTALRGLKAGGINHIILYAMIILLEVVQYVQVRTGTLSPFEKRAIPLRYGWQYLILLLILLFGFFGEQSFIYFQF